MSVEGQDSAIETEEEQKHAIDMAMALECSIETGEGLKSAIEKGETGACGLVG